MRIPFELPAGWPWSTWFFIATLAVYLLQRFPWTGIFLMMMLAMFWSIFLINAGMVGIIFEALTGRVSPVWLAIPALYFGGYYAAYTSDQAAFALLKVETARFNAGKQMKFDPARQDLVVGKRDDSLGIPPRDFVENYGVPRAFDETGQVTLVGTDEVCKLINSDRAFLSAGIQGNWITRPGKRRFERVNSGFCMVTMPGKPDKPTVEIIQDTDKKPRGRLQVAMALITLRDAVSGALVELRAGRAMPLRKFPMPVMGCALNSGAPAWECFHGFMRENPQPVIAGGAIYSSGAEVVAKALGLSETADLSRHAVGTERFQPIADRVKAELVAKEIAILERMLADPTTYIRDSWLWHLPDRPEIVAPYAPRIFDALEQLQLSEKGGDTAKNLVRLVSAMSDETLNPYRARLVALLEPATAKPWVTDAYLLYTRLDVSDPHQRDIVLSRLDLERRSFPAELLPPFCKMGAAAPDTVKQRLLALWKKREPNPADKGFSTERDRIDAVLYLTLARMGLKEQVGKVEQRYYGPDFLDIWEHVGPDSPEAICTGNPDEIRTYFREAGYRR